MAFVFALLAGFIMGGGAVGDVLTQRWKAQVRDAEIALTEIAERHQHEEEQSKALKQELAGVKFELNQARNALRAATGDDRTEQ